MEEIEIRKFNLLDCVIFAFMLGVSAAVGIYYAYKDRNASDAVKEYLVGGKNMKIFPIGMSLISSYISGIALLGFPAEMYVYGTQLWATVIGDALVSLTMAFVYLPVFYGLQITSSYEYLELRFNHWVRFLGSIIFLIKMLLYIPMVVYVPALAFNQVTGIDMHIVSPIVCAVCIFYTTLGGLKAVVWTDTIQTVIMFSGVVIVAILGTIRAGGFNEIWRKNYESERIEFFNMDMDPTIRHTFWSVVVGNYVNWLASCSVNQMMVQRCLSLSTLRKANITVVIMAMGIISLVSLSCYTGIVIYAAFYDCDPVTTHQIRKPDQILPFFVMELAESVPGLPGLFVSGVFSAALSTMSTGLNSMAGVIYEDIIRPLLKEPLPQKGASWIMKILVIIIGIICVGLVFLVEKLGGLIQAGKSLSGITAGPLLGIFTLGMFFPQANSTGALIGAIVSLHLVAWISLGTQTALANGLIHFPVKPVSTDGCPEAIQKKIANITRNIIKDTIADEAFFLYRMSYLWYTWVGFLTAILIGLIVSWLSGPNKYQISDKKLYTPIIHRFLFTGNLKTLIATELEKMTADVGNS